MKMTWGELKSHCLSLGFNKANAYTKDQTLFVNAANRAIVVIASTVKPIIDTVTIPHHPDADSPEYVPYSMKDLVSSAGFVFQDFTGDRPAVDGLYPLEDFKRAGRDILLLPKGVSGNIVVWYEKYPKAISAATPDSQEIELDYDVAMLVPVLMGFYIWMRDDETLAVLWRNEYDERSKEVLAATSKLPITIKPGRVI